MLRATTKTPSATKKWRPSSRSESNKLLSTLNVNVPRDLPRTRGKRSQEQDPEPETPLKSRKLFTPPTRTVHPVTAPAAPSRGIFELASLRDLICSNFRCPDCAKEVEVEFPALCIASTCSISCKSCTFSVASAALVGTKGLDVKGTRHERTTDYVSNVLGTPEIGRSKNR